MDIPYSTLKYYAQKFSEEGCKSLERHLVRASHFHYRLLSKTVRTLAFKFAEKHGKDIRHWEETRTAGKDWLWVFLQHNPTLSLRSPEVTSIARATAFNRPVVNAFLTHTRNCCINIVLLLVMFGI
jgi:hypothetical protein